MNDDELEYLRLRATRAFQKATPQQVAEQYRAIVGPTSQGGVVEEALETLREGKPLTPAQFAALEDAIRSFRPALPSIDGQVGALKPEVAITFPQWEAFRVALKPYLRSVALVERIRAGVAEAVGTGFLVAERLLVTNRHVLEELSSGTGQLGRGMARVNFGQEFGTLDREPAVDVVRAVAEHPSLDLALLEIDPTPLTLERKMFKLVEQPAQRADDVAILGYPFPDGDRNPAFIASAFAGALGVKRVAVGEVMKVAGSTLHHDCSTLGGNSGSPLVSLADCRIAGVHFQGRFATRNSAVASAELRTFLTEHGGP